MDADEHARVDDLVHDIAGFAIEAIVEIRITGANRGDGPPELGRELRVPARDEAVGECRERRLHAVTVDQD